MREIMDYGVDLMVDVDSELFVEEIEDGEYTHVFNEDGLCFQFKTEEWKELGIEVVRMEEE